MSGPVGEAPRWLRPSIPLLGVALFGVAYLSSLALAAGLVLAAVGLAAGVGLRLRGPASVRAVAPWPPLVALGGLALFLPLGPVPLLAAGFAGVLYVAWLVDDPDRPSGGLRRGAVVWAVPALGVLLAWGGGFLLPASAGSLGAAGALLAVALLALAYLVGRRDLFDRDALAKV